MLREGQEAAERPGRRGGRGRCLPGAQADLGEGSAVQKQRARRGAAGSERTPFVWSPPGAGVLGGQVCAPDRSFRGHPRPLTSRRLSRAAGRPVEALPCYQAHPSHSHF